MTTPVKKSNIGATATQREKLFAYLDEMLGAGSQCTPADYDGGPQILEYAIEHVEEQDALTCGCGVGPLMHDIEAWHAEFMAGKRNSASDAPFCLKIKFDPLAQGFILARDESELRRYFPDPLTLPKAFPVFARKEAAPLAQDVLSYLGYAEMTVLP